MTAGGNDVIRFLRCTGRRVTTVDDISSGCC